MPRQFLHRLQKIMDEYAGGVTSAFKTSKSLLERGLELMDMLKEDADKQGARDVHELMRVWENIQRMWIAESHIRTMLFREETRWPGYYFRADTPKMDEENWKCFANCRWNPDSGEWEMMKKDVWTMPGV
jgi:adenylylsulfate reductase subunit A